MTVIHPSSVVDHGASIGDGTEIGPFCHVGPGVEIGADCRLLGHVTVAGPTKIGPGNVFHPYVSIGQRSQDLKYAGEPTYLEIG
ncbi:MAG: acyl-[acyl-carrier-protein]--UDP-N-acetylglucosamine O-acyltransferase, partial [Verrucomicrobiota bacterium]